MKGGRGQVVGDGEQVRNGEWRLTLCGGALISFGSCQRSIDKS